MERSRIRVVPGEAAPAFRSAQCGLRLLARSDPHRGARQLTRAGRSWTRAPATPTGSMSRLSSWPRAFSSERRGARPQRARRRAPGEGPAAWRSWRASPRLRPRSRPRPAWRRSPAGPCRTGPALRLSSIFRSRNLLLWNRPDISGLRKHPPMWALRQRAAIPPERPPDHSLAKSTLGPATVQPPQAAARPFLEPHHGALLLVPASLHVGDAGRLDQLAQARKAVVARIELRQLLGDVRADGAEIGPALLVGDRRDGRAQRREQLRVLGGLFRVRLPAGLGRRRRVGFAVLLQHVEIDELVARGDERARRLALAEAVDRHALLADPRGKPREVAVARDDAEAVEAAGVEQVHGVDDHRAVGRVLAR